MTEEKFIKDVISKCRKEKQLTQEQLADLLNVSNKTVSKWERGISYPDITLIPMLAKVLDINISDLFNVDVEKSDNKISNTSINDNIIYNTKLINNFRAEMFVAFATLIAAVLLPIIILTFIQIRTIINFCYVISCILAIISLSFVSFGCYRYYCFFSNKIYKKLYLKTFCKNLFSYSFLIYFLLMIFTLFLIGNEIEYKILILFIQILFGSFPLVFINNKISIEFNKVDNTLIFLSIILLFVFYLLYLFDELFFYIIMMIISQLINYTIIFIQIKKFNIKGDQN